MARFWVLFVCSFLVKSNSQEILPNSRELHFTISKTFDGQSIPSEQWVNFTLKGVPNSKNAIIMINSPFYNDTAPNDDPGKLLFDPLVYEAFAVYFMNEKQQYLGVSIGPAGHYGVVLLQGEKALTAGTLPLVVSTTAEEAKWLGEATIPGDYFPLKVTKFNAYSSHGGPENRIYLSLYPSSRRVQEPDLLNPSVFETIDMTALDPYHDRDVLSPVWEEALKGNISFRITKTWEGKTVPEYQWVNFDLRGGRNSDVIISFDAPFYNNEAPPGQPGKPFLGLWDYEVVQFFFLNDAMQYLEVEIGPHGHHIVLLLNGERNTVRHSLDLKLSTNIDGFRWSGEAVIPGEYFPANISKFNAYSIHSGNVGKEYLALYPSDESSPGPDLHDLDIFQPIDMNRINFRLVEEGTHLSELWQTSIQGRSDYARSQFKRIFSYFLRRQWNNLETKIPATAVTLQGFQGGVELNYTMPRYEDPLYPPEYFVAIFENKNGEGIELKLFVDGRYKVTFSKERDDKLSTELVTLDYIVNNNIPSFVKGSVLVPPQYFPPNVSLLNLYSLFGWEISIAMTVKPVDMNEALVFAPNLNSPLHFLPVDFDLLVQSNDKYSSFWRQILNLPPVSGGSETSSNESGSIDQTPNTPTTANVQRQAQILPKTTTPKASELTKAPADIQIQTETSTNKFPKTTDSPVDSQTQQEAITFNIPATNDITIDSPQAGTITEEMLETIDSRINSEDSLETTTESFLEINITNAGTQTHPEASTDVISESNDSPVTSKPKPETSTDKLLENDAPENSPDEIAAKTDKIQVTIDAKIGFQTQSETESVDVASQNLETTISPAEIQTDINKDKFPKVTSDSTKETIFDGKSEEILNEDALEGILEFENDEIKNKQNEFVARDRLDEHLEETVLENVNNPLRLLVQRQMNEREEHKRRYEESTPDKNELPITFQIRIKADEPFNGKVENIIFTDGAQKESALSDMDEGSLHELYGGGEDTDYTVFDYGLLPPPHPICFTEGLIADHNRCQVFYECVIEDGKWAVYNWRCKRGYYYDPTTVACVQGYC